MEVDTSTKFSPSKLNTYKECPRRYRYRYVDKIKRDAQSVEAFVGSRVHEAFEALYEGLQHGKLLTLEEVVRVFEKGWESLWSDAVAIRDKAYAPEDWKNVGRECVRSYYRANAPFDRDKTVAVEKRLGFPLEAAGEGCRIEGFVDRLALGPDGAFEIHDYKTGKTLPAQEELDADWQLPIYEIAVRHAWPDTKAVRLIWHYVRHGKSLSSSRSAGELESLKAEIASEISAIRRDRDFIPRKSALCDWCEYRDLCPLWSHAEAVSRLPEEAARKDDGVRLVDQYAGLESEKKGLRERLKELERDQKALEEALVRYAQARELSAVSGLEGDVTIVEKEDYKLPTKTHDPGTLEALEKELRETPLWEKVSHLDPHRLLEGYKRKEWGEPVLRQIESLLGRYAKRVREKVLRFHRRKESGEE